MELPQFALNAQNSEQHLLVSNNPIFADLLQIIDKLKALYGEFVRLHATAFSIRNTNPTNTFFQSEIQILRDQDSFNFVGGFMVIVSQLDCIDFADPTSVEQNKRIIFGALAKCEHHFFSFNQRFQTIPELTPVIAKIYTEFTAMKQELSKLGLYHLPRFDMNQSPTNSNPGVQVREREEDTTLEERSRNRKRL